jgi:hypothetical protein
MDVVQGNDGVYDGSFVDHYIVPLLYPDILFSGKFPDYGFVIIGFGVLIINGILYWRLYKKIRNQPKGVII